MKKMVSESVNDFLNYEEDIVPNDDSSDENMDVEYEENIEDVDFPEDEEGEEYIEVENGLDEMNRDFNRQIELPEYTRTPFIIKLKDKREIEGVPMAKLSSGQGFLFKIEGQIKKIRVEDIARYQMVIKEEEPISESLIPGEYTFTDYMFEIADAIKTDVPDWEFLVNKEDEQDLIDWIEENQDLWDLELQFKSGISADDAANKIILDLQDRDNE